MAIKRIGIIVGGGPAPGINAVIGAATIEAINRGIEVRGFYEGFRRLSSEAFDPKTDTTDLSISDVARIHWDGGSILRTARTSLLDKARMREHTMVTPDAEKVHRVLTNLRQSGIDALITIGGDDTALSARLVCDSSDREIRLAHVPKTIDNDLPLPHDVPTFGFSTARFLGTQLVKNLMQDSQTTGRWYLVESMGRSAGWLAQAIGLSAGATLTLIPEEFDDGSKVQNILDVLEGAIIKRRMMGRPDGVAILAEGLAYKLGDVPELEKLLGRPVPLDGAGHPRLSEVNLVNLLKNQLQARFAARGIAIEMIDHELGYELRSADPTPYDMGYCRSLGYFAVELLSTANQPTAAMVSVVNGNLTPIDLHDMIDPKTNRTRVRMVDLKSDSYRIARAYMIRLEPADLDNPERLAALAKEANMQPRDFEQKFRRAATRRDL